MKFILASTSALFTTTRRVQMAITSNEFITALSKTWGYAKESGERWHEAETIGLAISGGVDSMALAVLCSNLQYCDSIKYRHLKFQAFIVDHRVRGNSEKEAMLVAKILASRGIPSEILKIKWHHFDQPHCLPNFESLARKKRYLLLGNACLRYGIDSLMLAHHEDDQAEQIIMRLVAGHRSRGLTGIKAQASIPECYGVFGVHESGGGERFNHNLSYHSSSQRKDSGVTQKLSASFEPYTTTKPICETGGIQIYRPLLSFNKTRLVSTCTVNQMPWFEDKTNHDSSFTMRNAIRNLYSHYKMPDALSKPAMIKLADKISYRIRKQEDKFNLYLSMVRISLFDSSSGIVKVEFPDLYVKKDHLMSEDSKKISFQLAAYLLRKVITLVTPLEYVRLFSLQGAAQRVFPELKTSLLDCKETLALFTSFTVAGVLFQPVPSKKNVSMYRDTSIVSNSSRKKYCWLLSRQPVSKTSLHQYNVRIVAEAIGQSESSTWTLFDGRFWIRIVNFSPNHELIVRFFQPEDMRLFLSKFKFTKEKKRFIKQLSEIAPGKVRWTLPTIFANQKTKAGMNFCMSTPLSLPSLGIDLPGAGVFGSWDIRYKKIYTSHIRMPNQL